MTGSTERYPGGTLPLPLPLEKAREREEKKVVYSAFPTECACMPWKSILLFTLELERSVGGRKKSYTVDAVQNNNRRPQ